MRVRLKFIKHHLIKICCSYAVTASHGYFSVGWELMCGGLSPATCELHVKGRGRRARAVQHVPALVPSVIQELCSYMCFFVPVLPCFSPVFVIGYTFLLTRDDVQKIHHHICPYSLIYSTTLGLFFLFILIHIYALID